MPPQSTRHLDIWQLLSVLEEDHASTRTSQGKSSQDLVSGDRITPIYVSH